MGKRLTLSSCRARWCVANIRIPRREHSVVSRKLHRIASSYSRKTGSHFLDIVII